VAATEIPIEESSEAKGNTDAFPEQVTIS